MSGEILYFNKSESDNLVEQTHTCLQKTLENKKNISKQAFSSDIPTNLENNKW